MKTIAQQIKLLALALAVTLTTSGCSFDNFRSPSADYAKPGDLSQDVESLPDPAAFKKTSADRVTINSADSMRRVESPERLLTQANDYFEQRRYHDSARLYKKYLATPDASGASPDVLATAHYRIGFVASKKTQYIEACQEYRQALQIAPFNNDYLFAYARACYEAGDYPTAEAQFAQLTSRAPGYPDGLYYYGLTLLESGDRARALQPLTAAKGDLEAYFLLADKHYAKGELQQAIQAETQMNQIAASLGLKARDLPHKSKASDQFLASSVAPASTNVPSQNAYARSIQENAPSIIANASSQINEARPSTSASVALPNASSVAVVPTPNPQLASNANPVPSQVESQEAPSQVVLPVRSSSENIASAPQIAPISPQLQGTAPAAPQNVAQYQATPNAQVAQAQTIPSPTVGDPQNVAQPQAPISAQLAQVQTIPSPTTNVPQNAAQYQTQIAQAPIVPSPAVGVPQNVAQYQAPTNAQIAQTQTIPSPAPNVPQNVAQPQAPTNAQIAQVQGVPSPTVGVPQNVAPYNAFQTNDAFVASASVPLPVPMTADASNFANSTPQGVPSQNVGVPFEPNAPLLTASSDAYAESYENATDDASWDDDDFAFACSGQPSEPVPTADLIGTEATAPQTPEESFVENEKPSEIRRPETSEFADALAVPSEESNFGEPISPADLLLNERTENAVVQNEALELAQTSVPAPLGTPQALETAPSEPERVADNLIASDVEIGNGIESESSQISEVPKPSFINFRPGSTMNASLVTLPSGAATEKEERDTPIDAEIPSETFVADYNVPKFPSEPIYEQNVENLVSTAPIQRVYTIWDLERLVSDWTLFEQNLVSYLTPTPVAEEMFAQTQNVAPTTPVQTISPSVPQQGYNSPEEFFRSTQPASASVVQQEQQSSMPIAQYAQSTNAPIARETTTPDSLANRTALSELPSEISPLKTNSRRNTTPEERLQAARAAGAEVVELTPEQYRQAVLFGTSRR